MGHEVDPIILKVYCRSIICSIAMRAATKLGAICKQLLQSVAFGEPIYWSGIDQVYDPYH